MERRGGGRLGPLVGRDGEVAALRALLTEGRRLVTVTGPAGVGKSRVAAAALDDADGPLVVPCDGADADAVVAEIARRVTGSDVGPGADALDHLAAVMGGRAALVVLEELDDLGDGATRLGDLLDACPTVRLVVTSRTRLRLRGETTLRLEPLAVPADDRLRSVRASPAADLFLARAREAEPSFALTAATAGAVGRICRATDGLPLAIELAAGWLRSLDVDTVADRASSSLDLFVSDELDRPARQRSLAATLAWALSGCTPPQVEVLQVLAAFPGGLPLDQVGELLDGSAPLDTIGQLVDRSLVRRGTGSRPRVTLPAPVRQAVRHAATGPGATSEVRALRLLGWSMRVAADQAARLRDHEPADAVARLDDEIANLRAGFELALGADDPTDALELAELLVPFLRMTGRAHEALEWVERAAPRLPADDHAGRARLGSARVGARRDAGDPVRARDEARAVFDAAVASGDPTAIAEASATFATATMWFGWDDEVSELLGSVTAAVDAAAPEVRARFHHAAANAAMVAGDLDRADELGRLARLEYGESAPALDRMRLEVDLARLAASRGEAEQADACFERAALLSARTGRRSVELVRGLASAAQVALERRETGRAVRLATEAHEAAVDLQSPFDQAQVQLVLGMALADGGQVAPARAALASSLRRLRDLRARIVLADGVLSLALLPEPVAPPPERALRLMSSALAEEPGLLDRSAVHWRRRAEALRERAAVDGGADRGSRTSGPAAFDDVVTEALDWLEQPEDAAPAIEAPFGQLSAREREVLALVARGLTDRQIAERLVLGVRTVNTHVSTMLRKLGVARRSDAAAWAIEHGL